MFTKIGWRGNCPIWKRRSLIKQNIVLCLFEWVQVSTSQNYAFFVAYPKPAFDKFIEPYRLSSKEPDLCLIPGFQKPFWPTILIESGWNECSWSYLKDDARLWLLGAQPTTQMVISICWSCVEGQIKGTLKVYERGVDDSLLERQATRLSYIEWLT